MTSLFSALEVQQRQNGQNPCSSSRKRWGNIKGKTQGKKEDDGGGEFNYDIL
jgi:hypothetical protein